MNSLESQNLQLILITEKNCGGPYHMTPEKVHQLLKTSKTGI